jgi:hypothetical protein
MTKNEKYTEISANAYIQLCQIADEHRGKYRAIYGNNGNEKWWLILYPAIHVAMNKEFNVGATFGLSFPTCDISLLPINIGSKFIFPSREVTVAFGYETLDLWREFLYPEYTQIFTRTR